MVLEDEQQYSSQWGAVRSISEKIGCAAETLGTWVRRGGARPPSEVMVEFIDDHRDEDGVDPICDELPIAPSTYYTHKACEADPSLRSLRAQRDEMLCYEIRRVRREKFEVYGVRKVWRRLNREGITVARCND